MKRLRSDLVYTNLGEPINDGMLVCENDGKIMGLLSPGDAGYEASEATYYEGALCPGFVNAHCHLELSHLHQRIPENQGLDTFVEDLMKQRATAEEIRQESMLRADIAMVEGGIVAVGDISNQSSSFELKSHSRITYHTFIERFGLAEAKADAAFNSGLDLLHQLTEFGLSGNLVPHAPYSVSRKLMAQIVTHCSDLGNTLSIHHQESVSENELFVSGSGQMVERFLRMGIDASELGTFGNTSAHWLASQLKQNQTCMPVHNVETNQEDIRVLQEKTKNLVWCFCPNANWYISRKLPDFDLFRSLDQICCIGTDSLASNYGLSMIEEWKTIRTKSTEITVAELIRWSSLNGAIALKLENRFGDFSIGKNPGLVHLQYKNTKELLNIPDSAIRVL